MLKHLEDHIITAREALDIVDEESVFSVSQDIPNKNIILEPISATEIHEIQSGYIPIEDFKTRNLVSPSTLSFKSSGTTSDLKSTSAFSDKGVISYLNSSILTFLDVLKCFFKDPLSIQGFSLIPTLQSWPNSSLAFMIDHFHKHLDVEYITLGDLQRIESNQNPIWIFGTSAHFIESLKGRQIILPKGSLIFETGGAKKGQKKFPRADLFRSLSHHYSIPISQIISEYSMCELASQAYDWQEPGQEVAWEERAYRFPKWVSLSVYQSRGQFKGEGIGSLSINDTARVDISSPIRTHDIAELKSGRFRLRGRVPFQVIKGCSNNVIESKSESQNVENSGGNAKRLKSDLESCLKRCETLQKLFMDTIKSDQAWKLLIDEFRYEKIACWAREELLASIDISKQAMESTLIQLLSNEVPLRWFFILPTNHSIAGLEPLFWSASLGCQMTVRVPPALNNTIISLILAAFNQLEIKINMVDESVKVGTSKIDDSDAILSMSSDETLSHISLHSPIPVQGFGEFLTAVSCPIDQAMNKGEEILKACFSLGQRGCFSARALLLTGESKSDEEQTIAQFLTNLSKKIFNVKLTIEISLAMDSMHLHYKRSAKHVPKRDADEEAIFPILKSITTLQDLSTVPFICPIVICSNDQDLLKNSSFFNKCIMLGGQERAEATHWNGHHQGQKFFHI